MLTHHTLASFLILEPLNALLPSTFGTCSLPLPRMLPERSAHSHPLALSAAVSFSEASLTRHPSGLPQLFSVPSPRFSLLHTHHSL